MSTRRSRLLASLTLVALSFLHAAPGGAQSGAWSALDGSAGAPDPRRQFAAVYDDQHRRYLIFGGFTDAGGYTLFNEVWFLSLEGTPAWTRESISGPTPGERHSPQWGYDAARNRLLIFGGYGRHVPGAPYDYLNDVWELSLDRTPRWTELVPVGTAPAGRLAGAAVYDPMRQRLVGFGGTAGLPVDTWVLNLQGQPVWQSLPVGEPRPNGSYGMTSVYDAAGDRMIIFGGSTSDSYYGVHNEVWALELRGVPRWSRILPSGAAPVPRRSGTAIFDPLRNRMVVYGGWDNLDNGLSSFLGDTWELSFDGAPRWTELSPAGDVPTGRDVTTAVYDPNADRMVIYGGWSGAVMLGDTRFLTWGGSGVPASLAAEASAEPGVAHVQWQVEDATSRYAAVYRRAESGEWTSLATAEVDASGVLAHDDATVEPGRRYDYMMVVGSQQGETFGGEVGVEVPSPLAVGGGPHAFALHRVAPNPVADRLVAAFALPGGERAHLALLDLAGRRWLEREVGSLGAGAHRVDLGGAARFPAGMYFLRLEQGGRVASTRVVLAAR